MTMTRDQMIAQLVTIAQQWGMKTPTGKDYTAETFARATDKWLKDQIQKSNRAGARLGGGQ